MKKHIFLLGTLTCMCPAYAQLNVDESKLGSPCYDEGSKYGILERAHSPNDADGFWKYDSDDDLQLDKCPETAASRAQQFTPCYIEMEEGDYSWYYCSYGTNTGVELDWIKDGLRDDACPYDTTWVAIGDTHRVMRRSGNLTSKTIGANEYRISCETEYGCAAGYYTTSTTPSATMTCQRCPSSGGIYGTSAIGNTSITGCYIPGGTSYNDGTGQISLSGDCYYTK